MTSPAKISLVAVFTVLATGGGWFQIRESRRQEAEIAHLRRQVDGERRQIQQLRAEQDDLLARTREAPPVPARAFSTGDAAFDTKMEAVLAQMNQLRTWLKSNPQEKTPAFEFLQDSDWIGAVTNSKKFNVQSAARSLRYKAKANLVPLLQGALKSYEDAHQGQLPNDLTQLAPFFVTPISAAILQRYEMRSSGLKKSVPGDLPILSEKASAITVSSDQAFMIFAKGSFGNEWFSGRPFLFAPPRSADMAEAVSKANQAFRVAHPDVPVTEATQLLPYFKSPADAADFAETQSAFQSHRR